MSDQPDISKALIQQTAEKYSETTALRAAVQAIPYIGGPLDTLIGGEGQKIQQRRIAHFVEELDRRLKNIEVPKLALSSEEIYDLMVSTFERVTRTRSEEKRIRFAQVVASEIARAEKIEDAETALRLIGELDDLHVRILNVAVHTPLNSSISGGLRALQISEKRPGEHAEEGNPKLVELFPDIPERTLRLFCSELVSKGLLRDEAVGRPLISGGEYFAATDLAAWLFTWISQIDQ